MTRIGNTSLDVFPLCLGGNVFGWTADETQSFAVLDAYAAAGGNFIDTADVYSAWVPGNAGGESETILGRWMADARQPRPDGRSRRRWEARRAWPASRRRRSARPPRTRSAGCGRIASTSTTPTPTTRRRRSRRRSARSTRSCARARSATSRPRTTPSRGSPRRSRSSKRDGPRPLRGAPAALQPRAPGRVRRRTRRPLRPRGARLLPLLRARQRLPHRQVPPRRRRWRARAPRARRSTSTTGAFASSPRSTRSPRSARDDRRGGRARLAPHAADRRRADRQRPHAGAARGAAAGRLAAPHRTTS